MSDQRVNPEPIGIDRDVVIAAKELMDLLWFNVGDTADWPVRIAMDADISEDYLKRMNGLKDALKARGYSYPWPLPVKVKGLE